MRMRCDLAVLLLGVSLIGLTSGCKKKVAVAPPPPPAVQEAPPPAPKAPSASITAEPSVVEPGQQVTVKWSSTNATEATISGLGSVAVEGSQEVRPARATTYELVAKGPGGSATASVTVSVMAPPPPINPPPPPVASKSLEDRIVSELSDVYFDYDKSNLSENAVAALATGTLRRCERFSRTFRPQSSFWKAIATNAARRSTTSASATSEPRLHVHTSKRLRCRQTA